MNRNGKRLVGLLLSVLLFVSVLFLWLHRWDIYDRLRLRGYQPPQSIQQLANATTMNDQGRRIFYVYRPELDDKASFNARCTNSERTIVLGCYVSGSGIYVYNVTDTRLNGILEVTAAHEMLHAAYERLSPTDKKKVNQMLNQAYDKVTDERLRANIEDYQKNGADVTNELHSILGTEVRSLPADLEAYYKRYFTRRLAIVEFSEKYEQAFSDRKAQVAADDQRLQALKQQIDESQTSLDSQKGVLNSRRAELESLLAAKQYAAYNNGVPAFNAQVSSFNQQVRDVGRLIDEYNALVAQRNAIALEEGELVKAIDSRPATIENQ